jgi:putative intracellular protease/amidase
VATVLFPLPDHDFDVTEVAVPWKLLVAAGHRVRFATERGAVPACDPLLLTGVLFGQLGAEPEPIAFYRELERDPAFLAPTPWESVDLAEVDALVLAGGHAPGMRQYLASASVQRLTVAHVRSGKPTAAICHGVLVMARAVDPETGRSVLSGLRTTCLPKYLERTAYWLTAWKLGRYYRTYPDYVEDEVRAALGEAGRFERGPTALIRRGTAADDGPAFVVEDGAYVSARWPGDAYLFAKRLIARLPA